MNENPLWLSYDAILLLKTQKPYVSNVQKRVELYVLQRKLMAVICSKINKTASLREVWNMIDMI